MALIKLIETSSFFESQGEQQITVLDLSASKEGLIKQAADSRIMEYVAKIEPRSDRIYVHILALGAGEYFGANRNADWFPEQNLKDYHHTFVTSPAHIFRNHVNKNPAIAIGQVIYSIYNERMHRVELIAWVDTVKGADIVERMERGEFPNTSMACKTAYDVCSICGNKAHTRQEYCEHLSTQLGRMYPNGQKVMALNLAPLKFFDQSIVVRPADVTSSILQKVASADQPIVGSVDQAVAEGLLEEGFGKSASMSKLSELVKEIEGNIVDYSSEVEPLLDKVKDPHFDTIAVLKNFKLVDVFTTMAHLGISPSIKYLSELIARKTIGDHMTGSGDLIAALIAETPIAKLNVPEIEATQSGEFSPLVHRVLTSSVVDSSMLPEFVEKRASVMMGSNVGYIGNGPHVEPKAYDEFRQRNLVQENSTGLMSMLHTLLTVGGAALAAKWYITKVIEQKMMEAELNRLNSHAKITLVKSASDYKLTYKLAKAAMVKALKSA